MTKEEEQNKLRNAARDLVRVERKCFYGAEPENSRLKKMRERIESAVKEVRDDN